MAPARLLAGDFHQPPPTKKSPATPKRDNLSEDVKSPSTSAFEWQKSMVLTQDAASGERTVQLEGQTVMVHRSGKFVELTDQQKKQWNVIEWTNLPEGRHTVLGCETLVAKFEKPRESGQKPATTQPGAKNTQQGPKMGELKNFLAMRDVNLKDGDFQVLGQRLIYDILSDTPEKKKDRILIYGYMPGEAKTLAQIVDVDPKTGRMQQQQSEEITWIREWDRLTNTQTSSIDTKGVNATGGR